MNSVFIALCRCRAIVQQRDGLVAQFPFRGVFAGQMVQGLEVHVKKVDNINEGKDYLLALDLIQFRDSNIICKLLRYKPL